MSGKDKALSESQGTSELSQTPGIYSAGSDLQPQADTFAPTDLLDVEQGQAEEADEQEVMIAANMEADISPKASFILDENNRKIQQGIMEGLCLEANHAAGNYGLLYKDFVAGIDIERARRELRVHEDHVDDGFYVLDDPPQLAHQELNLPRLVLNPPDIEHDDDEIFVQEDFFLISDIDRKIEMYKDPMLIIHQIESSLYVRRFPDDGLPDDFDPFFFEDDGTFTQEFGQDCVQISSQAVLAL